MIIGLVIVIVIIVLVLMIIFLKNGNKELIGDVERAEVRLKYMEKNKEQEREMADTYRGELFELKELVEQAGFRIEEVNYPTKKLVKIKKK